MVLLGKVPRATPGEIQLGLQFHERTWCCLGLAVQEICKAIYSQQCSEDPEVPAQNISGFYVPCIILKSSFFFDFELYILTEVPFLHLFFNYFFK